jgi:hypothetical protein
MAFDLMDRPDVPCGITIEEGVEIKMIMDRKLQMAPKKAPATVLQPTAAAEQIADPERLSRALSTPFIDKKILWSKVEHALHKQKVASLREILEMNPPEHGLAEVVGYFRFLREFPNKVSVVSTATELIPINSDQTKFVEVPYLLFNS